MSVESMTELSWVMYGISGAFAVAAVVLFFVLDIAKCWRMVSGRRAVRRAERRQTGRAVPGGGAMTIKLGCVPMEIGAEPEAFVGGAERTRAMDGLAVGQPGTEGLDVGDQETQELDIGDWETERLDLEEPETRNLYIEKSDIGEPGVENLYKEEPDQGGMETQALHKEDTGTERLVIEGLRTQKQTGEQCTFEWVTEKLSAFGTGEPDPGETAKTRSRTEELPGGKKFQGAPDRENALPDRAKDHAQEGAQTANFEIIQDIVYVQETAPAI